MKIPFAKNTRRNLVAGILNQGVNLLFPFLNRTLFLWLMGPQYLGLNGLFRSVIGALSLAELGFDRAIVASLYKPIAEDDRDTVCAYLAFYRAAYRWIALVVLVSGLCLLPFLRSLVHGSIPPDVNLHVLYLIHLLNSVFSYCLFAYRGPVLGAHQRNDVAYHIHTAVSAVQCVAVFFVLLFTRNYYAYLLALVLFTLAGNLLVLVASVRLFPSIAPRGTLPAPLRKRFWSDLSAIVMHKFGGIVSSQSDNLVISTFLGLTAVAAYGNYFYVVSSVAGFVGLLGIASKSGFGNKLNTEPEEDVYRLFSRINRASLVAGAWCAALMAALYQPFIVLWTKKNPSLVRPGLTPALMILFFYVNHARSPLLMIKEAATIWRADRWKPIVGAFVNLSLNISFVVFLPGEYKLDGVIFSTIVSHCLVQIPWEVRAVFASRFGRRRALDYWRTQATFALRAALVTVATWWISRTAAPHLVAAASRVLPVGALPPSFSELPFLLARTLVALPFASAAVFLCWRRDVARILAAAKSKA